MICKFCGKEIEEGSKICSNCNKPVDEKIEKVNKKNEIIKVIMIFILLAVAFAFCILTIRIGKGYEYVGVSLLILMIVGIVYFIPTQKAVIKPKEEHKAQPTIEDNSFYHTNEVKTQKKLALHVAGGILGVIGIFGIVIIIITAVLLAIAIFMLLAEFVKISIALG